MNDTNTISFQPELVARLNGAIADANVAIAEAAMSAVAQDLKVTVREFATALRKAAPALGTNNAVLSAAVKAAKEKGASLEDVTTAMAAAVEAKRKDDRIRAAKKASAKPAEDLKKAQAKVNECLLAMRTPLQVARDNVTDAEERVRQASKLLREERANLRKARAKLAEIAKPTKPTK